VNSFKYTILLLCFVVFPNAFAARDFSESGYLQCSANTSSQTKTVVLFVNGIGNDLTAAEDSRQRIEIAVRPSCSDCDFKKVYNQEDGFVDDVNELNLVGGWQLKAIDKSALSQYDFLYKDVPSVFKRLSDAGYENYGGYSLDDLKNELQSWLQIQRDLAKNGYNGATIRFYSPQFCRCFDSKKCETNRLLRNNFWQLNKTLKSS
jgi:hypothetical protein